LQADIKYLQAIQHLLAARQCSVVLRIHCYLAITI